MKIKSYLANVKHWDREKEMFKTVQQRVVPIIKSFINTSVELPSGVKSVDTKIPLCIHDSEMLFEFQLVYMPIDNPRKEAAFMGGNTVIFEINVIPEELVEIIPNTEEDFETKYTAINRYENLLPEGKTLEDLGLKRYEDLDKE